MKFLDPVQYSLADELRASQSRSRRNGKVARLPFELRQQVNRMLEDGIPYKLIIEKLGPSGKHLNEDNIGNWRLGGFQDHLEDQAINDRARIQVEAAADVIRDSGHVDLAKLQTVCREIALTQFIQALLEHGENLASESLRKNPAKLITLMNACCNVGKSTLAFEKRRPERGTQNSPMLKPNPSEPIRT
jgi:hypothetical protein